MAVRCEWRPNIPNRFGHGSTFGTKATTNWQALSSQDGLKHIRQAAVKQPYSSILELEPSATALAGADDVSLNPKAGRGYILEINRNMATVHSPLTLEARHCNIQVTIEALLASKTFIDLQ